MSTFVPDGAAGTLARRVNELAALYEFTERLFRAKSLRDVYDAGLDAVTNALGCDRVSILAFNDSGRMHFVAWRGLSAEYRDTVDGHSPWTAEDVEPTPICIGDADHAELSEPLKAALKQERIGALAFIPLLARGRLIGKFMPYYDRTRVFGAEEIELGLAIARLLGFAIERSRAEDALRDREAALEGIINRTPFILTRCDRNFKVQFASRAYAELLGSSTEEIVGRPLVEVMGEAAFRTVRPRLEEVLRGYRVEYEGVIPYRNIGPRVMRAILTPNRDEQGLVKGWFGSLLDVTKRTEAQKRTAADLDAMTRLQDVGSRCAREGDDVDKCLDAIVEAAIAITGARQGSVQLVEPGSDALVIVAQRGFDEAFLGFFSRVQVDTAACAAAAMRAVERVIVEDVTTSEIYAGQPALQVLLDAGVRAVQATPLVGIDGKVLGVISTTFETVHRPHDRELRFIDLLARHTADYLTRIRAEAALRRLRERLEAEVETRTLERDRIWNVSEDLLGVSNFEGYFVSINPAWTKTLGWSEQEIKSLHVSKLRHPDDGPHSMAGREQLARGDQTVRMENRFRHKDGSWRWIAWTMTADAGLIYVAGRHVTAEKAAAETLERAHQQLANAQKMEALGQLTGGVAHDFNNLMMIVGGYAQSLNRRLVEPKEVRALEAIRAAVSRGESLTRQLLSFSRRQPLNPIVVHPADAVDAIGDVLTGSTNVNIDLSIDIPKETWPICVDRSELALALVNIAINSRDSMPEGGRLSLAAENIRLNPSDLPEGLSGDFVALRIVDTGCGIAKDVLPRVFDPFFTTKEVDKGTGLGLSQVYGFAQRSGGTVIIASDLGRGTTVTVYLPRSHGVVSAEATEQSAQQIGGRQETVLVVEDNSDVRMVAVSLLEQLGYRTLQAESAPPALDALASGQNVDLVFTDVVIPGAIDGFALAQKIGTEHPHLPVVLTTGYAKSLDGDPGFAVLRKPYDISALGRVIREAIDAKTGRHQDGATSDARAAATRSFAG